jgi:hypothetical protein
VLSRVFKDKYSILNRQRLQIEGDSIPTGKRLILNEILLNRTSDSKHVPEFEFALGQNDNFYFPSSIVGIML